MTRFSLTTLMAALVMTGCTTLAPEYTQPAAPVAAQWPVNTTDTRNAGPDSLATQPAAAVPWQDFIVDSQLRDVVALALENNRDLRIAALNIERARDLYRVQRSELFPSIDAQGSSTRQRTPASVSPDGNTSTSGVYQAGVGASAYELDLFGRIRSLNEQALQLYLATEEARKSVQIALVAEVATAYLTLGADKERLDLARQTLQAQSQSYDLVKRSYELGVATLLDVRQAQTQVETARVDIAQYSSRVLEAQNLLNLLVGTTVPEALLPHSQMGDRVTLASLNAGLSSDILLSRPDVLAAERKLQAANANIGAARAAFFPRITLTASAGTSSSALSDLFDGGTGFWKFIPSINIPIFDAGRNQANLGVAQTDQKIAVADYEKAIQTAFSEVADALARRSTLDDQLKAQTALVEATSEYYSLSEARFNSGIDSYLTVLDAQRSLYSAQQALISLRLEANSSAVYLYRSLGGGWVSAENSQSLKTDPVSADAPRVGN